MFRDEIETLENHFSWTSEKKMKLTLVENSRDREFSLTSDTMRTLQEDETCGALGVDLPWLATSRVCIVYIDVHVDTYDIDRQKSKSMAANIVCAPVPWAWTYPGWPPPLDLLGTCRWGSPAHQSTHSHKTRQGNMETYSL